MSYLLRWVNEEGRLSHPVTTLEGDFSSGLRFVELLHNAGIIPAETLATIPGKHTLEVYDIICGALDSIGAVYKPSVIGLAATGARGGAPALLMAIKTALDMRSTNKKKTTSNSNNEFNSNESKQHEEMKAAIATVRPTKEPFQRQSLVNDGKDDFLERTIQANPKAFQNKNNNPFADVDMAVHLRKFHDFQRTEERKLNNLLNHEAQNALDGRGAEYDAIHAKARHRSAMDRDHLDYGESQWRLNQEAQIERERSQLRYELALQERRKIKSFIKHRELAIEATEGTDQFEMNLRRLGIADGDSTGSQKQISTASESPMDFLRRLEKTEKATSLSADEAHVMLEMISNKVTSARTARHERERRRRKMLYDQMSAQKQAEQAHNEHHEMESLLKQGREARHEAEGRWYAMKAKRREKEERARMTKRRQELAAQGAEQAMAELTEAARSAFEMTRSERRTQVNALAIDKANKLQVRHNNIVDMCTDVVDGLFYLVFAVIDKRLEVQRPLVLSDWLGLRQQFVQDTIRPLPPPPPPLLSKEESVCLALDKIAFSSLSGGWKVMGQQPMKTNGFEYELITKYETVLNNLSKAIRSKEQHDALPPNHVAAWTAFPQPYPYRVPQEDTDPVKMVQSTKYPQPLLRVRLCIIPDPVLSAKVEISKAPAPVAKLIAKFQSGGGGSGTPSPRPSPRPPASTPNNRSARYSFNGSFTGSINGDIDDDDNISIAPGGDIIAPSESATTNAVATLANSFGLAVSDPSQAIDAALLLVASSVMSGHREGSATSSSEGGGGGTPARSSGNVLKDKLGIVGQAIQQFTSQDHSSFDDNSSQSSSEASHVKATGPPLTLDGLPKYPPALVALSVFYHLGSQGGDIRPRRIPRSTDQSVMDLVKEEQAEPPSFSSTPPSDGPGNGLDTGIKVGKVSRLAGRWRRAAPKPVRGWVVSNFPRSPLEAKIFDYLLSRGPNLDEGEANPDYDTLIFEACPNLGKPMPSANKREDGSFEDTSPNGPLPQLDAVLWMTGAMESKETAPVMLAGSRFSNFARVSAVVKTAASTFKTMVAEAHNNPKLAAKKRRVREKEYADKLEKDRIEKEAEAEAIAALEASAAKLVAAPVVATPSPAPVSKKGADKGKGGKKDKLPKEPVLTAEQLAAQATPQAAALLVEKNTIFAEALNASLEEAIGLKEYFGSMVKGSFACPVSVSMCTAIETAPVGRRFSIKNDIEVRRNSLKSEDGGGHSRRSSVSNLEADQWQHDSPNKRLTPSRGDGRRRSANGLSYDDPASQFLKRRSSRPGTGGGGGMTSPTGGVGGDGGGGASRRSSIRDEGVVRRGSLRDGPSRRASYANHMRMLSEREADIDYARFAAVVEILEICTEAAAARRRQWDDEAASRLAQRLSDIETERLKALELEEAENREREEAAGGSGVRGSKDGAATFKLKAGDLKELSDIDNGNKDNEEDGDEDTLDSDICKDLPLFLPKLVDEFFILAMRDYRRRSVLSIAGRAWLKLRREGSTCMPEGERAVRRPLERWSATKIRCASTESIACLDMVKLESSISKLKSQMAWSATSAVRSSDGDFTGRVAANCLEKLKKYPEKAQRLVDDLEVDLGDVAAARYASSLEGLHRFSYEAMNYAESVSEAAGKAAADIATNEAKRVAGSEYLLFDYFNDIKALPLILEASREHSQNSAPASPSQPSSPITKPPTLSLFSKNKTPTPLAIAKATGNLGSMIKKKSLFENQMDSDDDESQQSNKLSALDFDEGDDGNSKDSKEKASVYLDECLKNLIKELHNGGLLTGPSGPIFESALRTLSPKSAPLSSLLDVHDDTESGYYAVQLETLKRKEYEEALLIVRIRGCEQVRGAVAKATRLQAWAKAAAEEAAGLPMLFHNKNTGGQQTHLFNQTRPTGPSQLGPLAHVVEARTKAEHRAVAACARHLRHIANDPQTQRRLSHTNHHHHHTNAAGGGSSAVRTNSSGSASNNPLVRAMQRVVSDGGPIRSVGVFDGIYIPDPSLGGDLGTSALSLEQLSYLVQLLADAWKKHSAEISNGIKEASSANDSDLVKVLHENILAVKLPSELAFEPFALFSGVGPQGEGRDRTVPAPPSVWAHPKILTVLCEVFHVAPWMPPRPSIDHGASQGKEQEKKKEEEDGCYNMNENVINLKTISGGGENKQSQTSKNKHQGPPPSHGGAHGGGGIPWRHLVHHLAVAALNYIPPYDELIGMAQRFRGKKVPAASETAASKAGVAPDPRCRVLLTRSDAMNLQFFFENSLHRHRRPSYPHLDFVGVPKHNPMGSAGLGGGGLGSGGGGGTSTGGYGDGSLSSSFMGGGGGGDTPTGGVGSTMGQPNSMMNSLESPRSQLNSSAGNRLRQDMSLNRNEIKAFKELYINAFQQETGVRLIAADALLLTLAAAPSPTLSSGFSDGLFRAASVASFLHPCTDHQPNELTDVSSDKKNTTQAVSDRSFVDSYSQGAAESDDSHDKKLSFRKHRVGQSGIVLSRRAIEMLLSVSPPPCGKIDTAASVSAFLDVGESFQRTCISFEEFARRKDVKQWCNDGWFRLRDLSTAFAQLRSEQ